MARRSSSAISARSQTARGGTSIPSADFDRVGEGERIGDGAVARCAPGQLRAAFDARARHQRFDALVHIAEPLFEPRHRLAIGGEAEMPGLDDAGMDRADRDLVQALALDRQEIVRGLRPTRLAGFAERMGHAPEAEIEPGPGVGRTARLQAVQAADGALEPVGRRMECRRPRGTRRHGIRR